MAEGELSIQVEPDGERAVVTKCAVGAAAARLRNEAAALAAARHPGVARVVDVQEDVDGEGRPVVRLRTRFVGSRTLATIGHVEPRRAAGLVAALATTVGDLHELGICHRRLTADHVVLASDGRPVLCGFADAVPRSAAALGDDVGMLGQILRELVAPTDDTGDLVPHSWRDRGRHGGPHLRAALLNLADQAEADEVGRRPSARQFAEAIRTTVPDATLHDPGTAAPVGPAAHDGPAAAGRWATVLRAGAVAAGVLALVAATAAVGMRDAPATGDTAAPGGSEAPSTAVLAGGDQQAERGQPPATTSTAPASSIPSTTSSTTVPPASPDNGAGLPPEAAGCAVVAGAAAALADGLPCPVDVSLVDGALRVGDQRYGLGVARAAVALGDFRCDGRVLPAAADLDSGAVAVFDGWPGPDEPVTATALADISSPRQLVAEPTPRGCHRVVVLDSWGLRHVIEPSLETP